MVLFKSSTDSETELPPNEGNGDLVDDLSHVHTKCDDLMAKLKALNQAAVDMPTATAAASTSPFVSPLLTPIQREQGVENTPIISLSEVAATADAVSDGLIHYFTGEVSDSVVVDTNQGWEELVDEPVLPIEATVIIMRVGFINP